METNSSPGSNVMDALKEIAFDLRWSWNHAADELWSQLDPELWALTRNPWVMPQTVSRERLQALTADPRFREKIDEIIERRKQREGTSDWFQRTYSEPPLRRSHISAWSTC
jgi:glycogen phosphorylase